MIGLSNRIFLIICAALLGGTAISRVRADNSSIECAKVRKSGVEKMICNDAELSGLDLKMSGIYAEAAKKVQPLALKVDQAIWIQKRNACWKSSPRFGCIVQSYEKRMLELQAKYDLAPSKGPFTFACPEDAARDVVVQFYRTELPSLIAKRGDEKFFMVLTPSGSGARYEGDEGSFREQDGQAHISWGKGAPEIACRKKN